MSDRAAVATPGPAFRLVRYFSLTSLFGVALITGALIWAYALHRAAARRP